MRTSVDGIWAAGDVTGRYQFTPIAQYQARIAIDDMFGRDRHLRTTRCCRPRSSPSPSWRASG